jgi:dipeptidyl aminopeptidase/acylaminoacyl peptidase
MRWPACFAALALAGCATTAPRFDQDVATTFAQDAMRLMVTPELELYYPAEHADAARRVAARAAECLRHFRAKDTSPRPRERALLFLTSANYNNAYVGGQQLGEPLHSVNPLSVTSELFHWYGLGGAEAGDIACHEMFHFAHYEQTGGFWRIVNTVLGPVVPPQAFLERWFTEGVAQYYEGRVFKAVGRPHSPLYRGAFESFVAMRGGDVTPGDLSLWQRELNPFSGAYLTGYFFVEWLVATFGEDKLWQLMERQGRSVFSPFWATLRVKDVYGLSVGALVDEWRKQLVAAHVAKPRPAGQRVLVEDTGQLARLASHPASGVLAVVASGNEQVPVLRLYEPDGRLRAEQRLIRLGTDRDWVFAGPGSMSGLSFTADGRWLYLLNDDLIDRGDTRAQLWRVDARTGEVDRVIPGLGRCLGGSISADGRTYTFVELSPGHPRIVDLDVETGAQRTVLELPAGVSVAAPQWSPSGARLAFSRQDAAGWNLVVREADGTLRELTNDGAFTYGARWADETHLVVARRHGAMLQAHRIDAETGAIERLSEAPFGVIDVAPVPGGVAFLNRVDVRWSIDAVSGAALGRIEVAASQAAPEREPSTDGAPPSLAAATTEGGDELVAPPAETAREPAAPRAPGEPSPHEPPPLVVEREAPSSPFPHVFIPQLRVPGMLIGGGLDEAGRVVVNASVTVSLMGRDRLGKHTWAVNATLGVPSLQSSVQLGYRNLSLAPWSLVASASRDAWIDEAYWSGGLYAQRSVFTVPVTFGVQSEVWQPFDARAQAFIGPTVSLRYGAGDSTAYGGPQRTFSFSLNLAGYPRALGSARDMLDLRVGVSLSAPLPLSKRHSLVVSGVGRSLPGAPDGAMRIGGLPSFTTLFQAGSSDPFPRGPGTFLPGTLVEGLRGFDDFALRARHAILTQARYRYSFIIDRGTASLLWLLPSFFLRQIDVEAFGTAAFTDNPQAPLARALGTSVSVRTVTGGTLALSLTYQFAWRFDFGLPPLHVVGVSFD